MTPRKLNLFVACFPYGGNGASPTENPRIRHWLLDTVPKANKDERIGEIWLEDFNDTPITMTRNRAVVRARECGADLLLMIDSDMWPDIGLDGDPEAKPFWDEAFDFIYNHYEKGPMVVGAPYCGTPPHENVFVFRWGQKESGQPNDHHKLEAYGRDEAIPMRGVQECAALPTGLILFDMRAFELTDPTPVVQLAESLKEPLAKVLQGDLSTEDTIQAVIYRMIQEKMRLEDSWFYYQWTDETQSEKGSTEDVTATRDISMAGVARLGYNPIHCAWSSWAGHWKPKCVTKPLLLTSDHVDQKYKRAVEIGRKQDHRIVNLRSSIVDHIDWSRVPKSNGDVRPKGCQDNYHKQREELLKQWEEQTRQIGSRTIKLLANRTPESDLAEISRLVQLFCRQDQPIRMAEVGCWVGESATAIMEAAGEHPITLCCVDHWKGSPAESDGSALVVVMAGGPDAQYERFCENVAPYLHGQHPTKHIKPMRMDSLEAAKCFPDGSLDLVYIDADHTYEGCKRDLEAWLPKVRPGGIFAGHDYCDSFPGVKQAVDEFLADKAASNDGTTAVWFHRVPVKTESHELAVAE